MRVHVAPGAGEAQFHRKLMNCTQVMTERDRAGKRAVSPVRRIIERIEDGRDLLGAPESDQTGEQGDELHDKDRTVFKRSGIIPKADQYTQQP